MYGVFLVGSNTYRKISNMRHTSECDEIVYHSDVVGASHVSTAPTTSSFLTNHLASIDCAMTSARQDKKNLSFRDLVQLILETWRYPFATCHCYDKSNIVLNWTTLQTDLQYLTGRTSNFSSKSRLCRAWNWAFGLHGHQWARVSKKLHVLQKFSHAQPIFVQAL